ncbi:MAG: hypothetical protein EBR79_03505, partial [Proteobacteria bacterium]|nr:hypothetical protein [Pseudomonadota bacterium]
NKITNPALLARFGQVAREDFTSPTAQHLAYLDQPAPMDAAHSRHLQVPMATARLLQELNLTPQTRLLVLQGGTGYSAAIAAPLVGRLVYAESDETMLKSAQNLLKSYPNIAYQSIQSNSDTALLAHYFNAILIDTPFEHLPIFQSLTTMLDEGGILAATRLNSNTGLPTLFTLTKRGKKLIEKDITETKIPIPTAYQATPAFHF